MSKPADMKKSHTILASLLAVFLIASLFTLGAASRSAEREMKKTTCCKERINACGDKESGSAPGDVIPDNLSRQFMSIISSAY